ncbi:hypothetical protein [Oscillibacter sp.]|uniref:hypothetical protein n=1 Tax=Oscillibacter sp. TaxID=1945593 RepID=UPI00289C8B3B|nr:hypothetical protein [Oscillibacter sp.]
MSIALATKFAQYVDEQFSAESKRALLTNQDFDWDGAHTVKIYKVTTAPMNDYGREGAADGNWSRYGAVSGLDATTEEMQLTRDRSFTFATDVLDENETVGALNSAAALARQLRQVVIPEMDGYTYGKMCAGAGTKPAPIELTPNNIYAQILEASQELDNAEVPETERVLVVTPATYAIMKKSTDIVMETDIGNEMRAMGVLGILDGMSVQKVPANRLPAGFGFMVAHPCATVAPAKLEQYNIHSNPPGISGDLVEGRVCYDAFVMANKAKAIYYQSIEADGLTVASAAGSTSGKTALTVTPTKGSGNSYVYATAESVSIPAVGADCSAMTAWDGSADITATTGNKIVVVEVDSNGKAVKAGSATVTAKA